MNIFDFEHRLKNHAANSRGKVDMNKLLSDLDIKPQTKSYRKHIYFFVTGIVLVGLGYLTHSYVFDENTAVQKSAAVLQAKTAPSDIKTLEKEILSKTPISEETITINNTPKATNTSNSFQAINNIETATTVNKFEPTKSNNKSQAYKTSEVKNTKLNKANSSANSSLQEKTSNSKVIQDQNAIFKSEANQNIFSPTANSTKTEKKIQSDSKIMAALNSTRSETLQDTRPTISNNAPVALLPSAAFAPLPSFKGYNKKGTSCPQFSDRLWHLYIIPEVGYTLPMKSLRLDDENFRFTFDERVANETTIEGINASLFLQFKNEITGLYVKPGVSYSRITERIDFVRRDLQIDTSSVTTITRDTDGEIISEITEQVINETERVTTSRVHYQLHEFELPVALGYSFNFDRFAIDIEAGIKLNFLQRATGQILYRGAEFNDLRNGENLFKNSVGLGFFGGVLFKRQLNRRTELYLAPRFSFNTLSYSSNSNPITQQYNIAGLHAGLIYAIY